MKRALAFAIVLSVWIAATAASARAAPDGGSPANPPPGAPVVLGPTDAAKPPEVVLPPEIARVLTDYETAWTSRDAAALARIFTEDGFVLPNGHAPVRGRAAIEEHYRGAGGPLSLRALAFAAEGKTGYIVGEYSRHVGERVLGKFTLTIRKGSDGRWMIFSDMDSSNQKSP